MYYNVVIFRHGFNSSRDPEIPRSSCFTAVFPFILFLPHFNHVVTCLAKIYLSYTFQTSKFDFLFTTSIYSKIYITLQLQNVPVQSLHIITKVVSSNPIHGEVCSIQHYVIKFVSDLRQVSGFLSVLQFRPPIKLTATK